MIIGFEVFNSGVNFVGSRDSIVKLAYTVSISMLKDSCNLLSFEFLAEIKILHRIAYFITQYHCISYNKFSKTEIILKILYCASPKKIPLFYSTPL